MIEPRKLYKSSFGAVGKLYLTTALVGILASPAIAQQMPNGQWVADGTVQTVPGETVIDTTASTQAGPGSAAMIAKNGGTLQTEPGVSAITSATQAAGAVTQGPDSTVDLNVVDIKTSGYLADGVRVGGFSYPEDWGGHAEVTGSTIATTGQGAQGVRIRGTDSTAEVTDTQISTSADYAHGIYAQQGGSATATNVTASTIGVNANGAKVNGSPDDLSDGTGTSLSVIGGKYETTGRDSDAILAKNGGSLKVARGAKGTGTNIHTTGDGSAGIEVDNATATVQGATILTEGDIIGITSDASTAANGILATNGGKVDVEDTSIETTGYFADGFEAEKTGAVATMKGGSILTRGDESKAVTAYDGGVASVDGVAIRTEGEAARGAVASGLGDDGVASAVHINASTVKTAGADSSGVEALAGAQATISESQITTNGVDAMGILARDAGSKVTLDGGSVTSLGFLGNASGEDPLLRYGTVTARNGAEIVATGTAIANRGAPDFGVGVLAQDAGSKISLNNSTVDANKGVAARDGASAEVQNSGISARQQGVYADGEGSTVLMQGGTIDMTASDFRGEGALAGSGGTVSLDGVQVTTANDYTGAGGKTGYGALVMGESTVNLTNTDIQTNGSGADGVRIGWQPDNFTGGTANVTKGVITTKGSGAVGVRVLSDGSNANIDGTKITTGGEQAYGVWADDGGAATISNATVTTEGDGSYGLDARGEGSKLVASNVNVSTSGAVSGITSSSAVVAEFGGTTEISDSTVTTSGAYGKGLYAQAEGATLTANNVDVRTTGDVAHGIEAYLDDAKVVHNGGNITTEGQGAYGAFANQTGDVDLKQSVITTRGEASAGVKAQEAGSELTLEGGSVSTSGLYAQGARAETGGRIDIDGAKISTSGDGAYALNATDENSVLSATNATISTTGGIAENTTSSAVVAEFGGNIDLSDSTVSTTGKSSMGLLSQSRGTSADPATSLTASNVRITTSGDGAYGAAACSLTAGSSQNCTDAGIQQEELEKLADAPAVGLELEGSNITTSGQNSYGVQVLGTGASAKLDNTVVSTTGTGAKAINVDAGQASLVKTQLNTIGEQAHGASVANGGTISLTDSNVATNGAGANAVDLSGTTADAVNTVSLTNSVLESDKGASFSVAGGTANIDLINTKATVNDGRWLDVHANSNGEGAIANVFVNAPSLVKGAAITDAASTSNVTFKDSAWTLTGDSNLTKLVNDNSVIDFAPGSSYKTLTVGSLQMNQGAFYLNTVLNEGGAATQTDKVVVTGDAEGSGKVFIRNNGGTGAYSGTGPTDGIEIIEIGGQSNAEFNLGAPAVVGIYDYKLVKADGQNWYLQTEGQDPVPPVEPDVDPVNPVDPDIDPVNPVEPDNGGHIIDIVPGYSLALTAAQNQMKTTLGTFHERVGELRSRDTEDGFHVWSRATALHGWYKPDYSGFSAGKLEQKTSTFQLGGDYSVSGALRSGDKLSFGVFGTLAKSNFDVRLRTTYGSVDSKGIGGYLTWQENAPTTTTPGTGTYVDLVAKKDWFDFDVRGSSLSGFDLNHSYDGEGTAVSIETGYGYALSDTMVIQPQAQLVWSKVTADDFIDSYGIAVRDQEAESLVGRLGVRLEDTYYLDDASARKKGVLGASANRVVTFVDASLLHEFKGDSFINAGGQQIGADMGGTSFEVGLGLVADLNDNTSIYARGSGQMGGPVGGEAEASVGIKYTW